MSTPDELQKLLPAVRKGWEQKILSKLSMTQAQDRQDKPALGPLWVSRCAIPPPPENDLRELVFDTIRQLAEDATHGRHDAPAIEEIPCEWLGPRPGVDRKAPEPAIGEPEKYAALTQALGAESPVVLFLHGGNLTFGGPVTYRPLLQQLSKASGARVFTPAYRLAPKSIFPSALLDALSAYLYLLAPPPGAHHRPIRASQIILAGESAGCSLVFALTKVLLCARQGGRTSVRYHGVDVPLELPAGITAFSPYCDFTVSLPSERLNMPHDVFLHTLINPVNEPAQADPAVNWPSTPARHDYTCHGEALDHPLVSPVAVADWSGAPPIWIGAGARERPVDHARVLAQRAAASGVPVRLRIYEDMPHAWFSFLPTTPATQQCFAHWAAAMRDLRSGSFTSGARAVNPWTRAETRLDLAALTSFPLDTVAGLMRAERLNRRPVILRPRSHL